MLRLTSLSSGLQRSERWFGGAIAQRLTALVHLDFAFAFEQDPPDRSDSTAAPHPLERICREVDGVLLADRR